MTHGGNTDTNLEINVKGLFVKVDNVPTSRLNNKEYFANMKYKGKQVHKCKRFN